RALARRVRPPRRQADRSQRRGGGADRNRTLSQRCADISSEVRLRQSAALRRRQAGDRVRQGGRQEGDGQLRHAGGTGGVESTERRRSLSSWSCLARPSTSLAGRSCGWEGKLVDARAKHEDDELER